MPESTQHKLDRIRPPRVQITYDVETRGSFVKMELPFVVGILADLSGNVDDPNRVPLRERKYVEIDRDNFNDIMKSIGAKAQVNGGGKVLSFEKIDDFSPISVLKQLDANEQYEKRTRLSDVVAKLDGNVNLQKHMIEVLRDESKRNELKSRLDEIKALPSIKSQFEPAGTEEKKEEKKEEPGAEKGGDN
jgi:type VI secretion system protein ImpB